VSEKLNICIVTKPGPLAAVAPLSNLVDILQAFSHHLYIITGNDSQKVLKTHPSLTGFSLSYNPTPLIFSRILAYASLQIKIAYHIMKINKNIDVYLFFFGESLVIPSLMCKILNKPVVLSLAGSVKKITENDQGCISKLLSLMETLDYRLADNIILYSPRLVEDWELNKYRPKIRIAHEHFLDFNKFQSRTKLSNRDNLVGYIGRLSEEKGILNFVKAIPGTLIASNDTKFLIGGDGQLRTEIEKNINAYNLKDKVKFTGWISHDDLVKYFNELKLVVVPSYTEGLPNIMIEAMACGTVVLATPVGSIPDFIEDGVTGFIIENNSPECITSTILKALNHPNLEQIANNGLKLIHKEFTIDKAVEKYRSILNQFCA
jgi:glycosyltransferase involved in cell wall biosynthesis